MSSLMHKPTIEGPNGTLRRAATANPAFKPEFARSLRMHPVLAGAVAAVVLTLLVAFAFTQKTMYSAEALVYIEPFNSKVLGDSTNGTFDSTKYESLIAQQMLTAQRADIIAGALAGLPRQVWAAYGPTPQIAAAVLQNQLKVARVSTSYQVSISLKGPSAQNTAAIVNAVTTAYLEAGRKDEISQADQRAQLLSEECGRIEQELSKDRVEQTRLGSMLGVANPGGEGGNPYDMQLDALRSQLVTARAAHDQAAAQLAAISGAGANHGSGLTAAANDAIASDAGLGSMKSTINARRAQLATQMAGLTASNPIYKQDQDELADLDKTLETMTVQMRDRAARTLQDKLRTELERTSDVEGRTNAELARMTASATTASPRLQRAAELAADVQRLTTRYTTVDNALHSLQLDTTGPGMAHLALAAAVPTAPEPNRKRLILLAALPLALLCGLGAAVYARKRDRRIYLGTDVEDVLGFAPIAILPARGEVSADVLDEYSLRLAAGVEGAYRSGNARTFVITAVSAATDTQPLVDALDRKLVELGLGVVVVAAAAVFEPQVAEAGTRELDPAFDRHYEGLAATLFARMKAEHDVILLDSPALLVSAQAEYVARCADVTLLVAESAVTTRGELYQAGALLQRLNVAGVGSVLAEIRLRYADGALLRGIRALESRPRGEAQVRKVPPAYVAPVQVVAEPIVAVPVEPDIDSLEHTTADEAHAPEAQFFPQEAAAPEEAAPVHLQHSVYVPGPVFAERSESVDWVAPEPVLVADAPAEAAPAVHVFEPSHEEVRPVFHQSSSSSEESEPRESRSWFKRIFQRDAAPVFSILPDDDDEGEASAMAASHQYDQSRYDIPVSVPEPSTVAMPASSAEPISEPDDSVVQPAVPFLEPVTVPEAVQAQIVEDPLPEVTSRPVPLAEVAQEALPAQVPVVAFVPRFVPPPAAADPDALAGLPYAFQLNAVAPVRAVPSGSIDESGPEPAVEPADQAATPRVRMTPEVIPYAVEPEVVREPLPKPPSRPLSFLELSQMQEASGSSVPAGISAPPVQPTVPEPALPVVVEAAPLAVEAAEAAPGEWAPKPLNRWDPIPPLRNAEEPWRISRSNRKVAVPQADIWGVEDPVRIPPTDRWADSEAVAAPVAAEAEPAVESNDIVLTRRWGLLSRFQQGESFQSARRAPAADGTTPEQRYLSDIEPDSEAGRRRR